MRTNGLDAATRYGFNDATINYYAQHQSEIDQRLQPDQAKAMRDIFALIKYQTKSDPNLGFWNGVGLGGDTIVASISNGSMFSSNTGRAALNVVPNLANGIISLFSTVQCVGSDVMSGCEEQAIADAPKFPTFDVKCDSILGAAQCAGGEILGVTVTSVVPLRLPGGARAGAGAGAADDAAAANRAAIDAMSPGVSGGAVRGAPTTVNGMLGVNEIAIRVPGTEVSGAVLQQLTANGVKFSPANVLATGVDSTGRIVFLEIGTATGPRPAGLAHVVDRHVSEFANIGVSEAQIPAFLMNALKNGKIVGYQGRDNGRAIYETVHNGIKQRVAITVSNNGFIVGANPAGRVK